MIMTKIIENAKSLLQTVQNTLTTANVNNKSTQQFLQGINNDVDTYMDALHISQRGLINETHKMFL